jgi:hypothetical protein
MNSLDKLKRLRGLREKLISDGRQLPQTRDLETTAGRQYIRWLLERVTVEMAIEAEKQKRWPIESTPQF